MLKQDPALFCFRSIYLLNQELGFTFLDSIIRMKSTWPPVPSSACAARPITCPVFTISPLLTEALDRLLYTVKYLPCRIITIIPSPVLDTALTSPLNTAFTAVPGDGVEIVIPGLSIMSPSTLLVPNGIVTAPLSTGQGRLPRLRSKLAANVRCPSFSVR